MSPNAAPTLDARIVAVIPCWNARRRLPAVLAALSDQVAAALLVDNGSTDGTADWLRTATGGLPLTLIANAENRGWPTAVNQGIVAARAMGASAILLVNDDARFEPGAVAALVEALLASPRAAAASPKLCYADRPGILNGSGGQVLPARGWAALRGAGEADRGQYDDLLWADYPSGAACLLRPAALDAVGLFDEAYYLYYEDADWGLRARAAGWATRYAPRGRVQHVGSAGTAGDPARRRYYNVRNRLRFARRHAAPLGRLRAWLETLRLAAVQPLRWLWPERRRDAEAVMLGIADHLRRRYGRSARFG
ncbi:MAG: glycosyltransferase family 2 protein [Caldilineae bacterium]|nr:glycosyltransferase family 2 protein [Chloroflexota bacterium]MCB9177312.1 glycosyltransferase family 2 protein [Caldilineae bacterium]